MNLEQAAWQLENSRVVPISAIEFLIAEEGEAASALLARLAFMQADGKPPVEIELGPPHPASNRIHFRLPRGIITSATNVATLRIVIALGALRSTAAVPALLEVLARALSDTRLGEAVGWALATIGEAALPPLLSFAHRRKMPGPARSVAIMTIGYIADPRVPAILDYLWREYCLEEPRLAIAALLGLSVYGLGQEARARAVETERVWRARDTRRHAWTGADFESAAELIHRGLTNVGLAESLPL